MTKNADGEYDVTIGGTTVTLPAGSKRETKKAKYTATPGEVAVGTTYGTPDNYLLVEAGGVVEHIQGKNRTTVFQPDPTEEEDIVSDELTTAWNTVAGKGGRRSRVKHQARRTKRNGRNGKRSKTRKLSAGRR